MRHAKLRHARRAFIVTATIALSACTLDDVVTQLKQADHASRGLPAHSGIPVPLTNGDAATQTASAQAPILQSPAAQVARPAPLPRSAAVAAAPTPAPVSTPVPASAAQAAAPASDLGAALVATSAPVPPAETTAPTPASVTVAPPTPAAPPPAAAPSSTAQISAPAAKAAARAADVQAVDFTALQRQLSDLEVKVAALTAENQRQMERLTLVTNGAIADMEQLFNALRLELRSSPAGEQPASPLRRRSSAPAPHATRPPSGQGGPFQPWPPQQRIQRAPADAGEPLLPNLQTLFMLHQIVRALPLSTPLQEAVVTGPFGYRRDPFNRRSAFHDGIDLQAPMRSPVHATATGTVVVAGMRPAYGRVVEIDHGFGIRTRYAHLASVAVKEGDRIERNALVGALGSSGRSASPHLHYEVLFNGRPHDPADLLVLAEGIRSLR